MDIYDFIRSGDVAAHCREIGKTWNTVEKAVIIGRSNRPVAEKHEGWRGLIAECPDMPAMRNCHGVKFGSIHKKLAEIVDFETDAIERFKVGGQDVVYRCKVRCQPNQESYDVDSVFSTFRKALAYARKESGRKGVRGLEFDRVHVNHEYYGRGSRISVVTDFDGTILEVSVDSLKGWPDNVMRSCELFELFYVDIPVPFKCGDLLVSRDYYEDKVFVLDGLTRDNKDWFKKALKGKGADGSDLIGWGFYIDEHGYFEGDHTKDQDAMEYYGGKLEGVECFLHYVSLFLKKEIDLPSLVATYGAVMAEHGLAGHFRLDQHGVYIPKEKRINLRPFKSKKFVGSFD